MAQFNSGTGVTTIVDHLKYDSFGNITAQSNSAFQPLVDYTGQLWDSGAGLYYDHARWYDPKTGRFISQDPTSFAAGDVNLYRYVGNGPTNATDPTGLDGALNNAVPATDFLSPTTSQFVGTGAGGGAVGQPDPAAQAGIGGSQLAETEAPGVDLAVVLAVIFSIRAQIFDGKTKLLISADGSHSVVNLAKDGSMMQTRYNGDPVPTVIWTRFYYPDGGEAILPNGGGGLWSKLPGGDWEHYVAPPPEPKMKPGSGVLKPAEPSEEEKRVDGLVREALDNPGGCRRGFVFRIDNVDGGLEPNRRGVEGGGRLRVIFGGHGRFIAFEKEPENPYFDPLREGPLE